VAVLIGVSKYDNEEQQLPEVLIDIERMAGVLKRHQFQCHFVIDPKVDDLRKELNRYRNEQADRLIIYFAGHGVSFLGNGAICARDYQRTQLRGGGYMTITDVMLSTLPSNALHVLFIFDSCYSGTAVKDATNLCFGSVRDVVHAQRSYEVFTGCNKVQRSHGQAATGGVFTRSLVHVLNKITDAKVVDAFAYFFRELSGSNSEQRRDIFTTTDLFSWIERILGNSNYSETQTPQHRQFLGIRKMVFTSSIGSTSLLTQVRL